MKIKVALPIVLLFFFIVSCQKDQLNISFPEVQTNKNLNLVNDSIYVGARYQGGVIFWIDSTGQHGLIVANKDVSENRVVWWNNNVYQFTNANLKGLGRGKINTSRIIDIQGPGQYAAQLCKDFSSGGYKDWYLPSIGELTLLHKVQANIGTGIPENRAYWSSTESDAINAYAVNLGNGFTADFMKDNDAYVRAIRIF